LFQLIALGLTPRESSSGSEKLIIGITPNTDFPVCCFIFLKPGFRILISPRNLLNTNPLTSFLYFLSSSCNVPTILANEPPLSISEIKMTGELVISATLQLSYLLYQIFLN
jgi:hypothetical protein